jgi:thiamine biosynthesis protein ThiS
MRLPSAYFGGMLLWRRMKVMINGQEREFAELATDAKLVDLIAALGLKGDRVAIEHNGSIVTRNDWQSTPVNPGDRLEIVHFVGGGAV